MWWWVLVTFAGILLIIILLLSVPLYLFININSKLDSKFRVRLSWLFGLVRWDIKRGKPKQKKQVIKPRKKRRKLSPQIIFKLIRIKGLAGRIKRLVSGILGSISIKNLTADLKVGLESPADTALLFAVTGPLNALLHMLPYKLTVCPVFNDGVTVEAYIHGTIKIQPVLLMPPVLEFLFSPQVFNIIRAVATAKRR